MTPKFSLIIRWSDDDHCFIAWSPEFGSGVKTHGATYEDAARAGREVIELLMETHKDEHLPLPEPWSFSDSEDDERLGKQLFPSNAAYQNPKLVAKKTKVKNVAT